MSTIQWEYEVVERPFCEQLQAMGWQWIEGDPDLPETTERTSSREVLLKDRLAGALRRINLRDGEPWLDDARVAKAIRDLEQAGGHRLMEINQAATQLLIKGTVAEGLPDWNHGREQPIRFIDWDEWEKNDFLVINQFKVELTSGRGHIIPDAVLFVNGIPLVVAEFKSPAIENPIGEAINQLLRYSNQRREVWPTLYQDNEGAERLFHTHQLLIASDFFESRAGTVGAPPEAYLEWADASPVPLSTVAEELGVIAPSEAAHEAAERLAEVGPEQTGRAGVPLFFREKNKRPEALRSGAAASLASQQVLASTRTSISWLSLRSGKSSTRTDCSKVTSRSTTGSSRPGFFSLRTMVIATFSSSMACLSCSWYFWSMAKTMSGVGSARICCVSAVGVRRPRLSASVGRTASPVSAAVPRS